MGVMAELPGQESEANKRPRSGGYSIRSFICDNLVPLDAYVCMVPEKPRQLPQFSKNLLHFTRQCEELYAAASLRSDDVCLPRTNNKKGLDVSIEWPFVPETAICMVRLTDVEIDGGVGREFNFNQATEVKIKLGGGLLFPPSARWCNSPTSAQPLAVRPSKHKKEDDPWVLAVEVSIVLLATVNLDGLRSVKAECRHIVFDMSHGDAMIESWLPTASVMLCIQIVLSMKLECAVNIPDDGYALDEN